MGLAGRRIGDFSLVLDLAVPRRIEGICHVHRDVARDRGAHVNHKRGTCLTAENIQIRDRDGLGPPQRPWGGSFRNGSRAATQPCWVRAFSGVTIPFFYDLAAYGRFVIAVPVLVLADIPVGARLRQVVKHFLQAQLIREEQKKEFGVILIDALRLRDSRVTEMTIIALVYLATYPTRHTLARAISPIRAENPQVRWTRWRHSSRVLPLHHRPPCSGHANSRSLDGAQRQNGARQFLVVAKVVIDLGRKTQPGRAVTGKGCAHLDTEFIPQSSL